MNDLYQKFDAIIVDNDLDSRMRLKQATASVHQFNKVWQASSLREAAERAGTATSIDVLFISYRFEQDEVGAFVKRAKEIKQTQDTAFILVLPPREQDSTTVATNVMSGLDGFLFEPYSVDQLVEITRLSARVKSERSMSREIAALRLMVTDAMNNIDKIAHEKAVGREGGRSMKAFKELAGAFKVLDGERLKAYYDIAIECFENAPVPKRIFNRANYTGPSARVKERLKKKRAAKAAAEGKSEEGGEESAETAPVTE